MVVIGFEQVSYTVAEGDLFVNIAVVIINGQLSRPVDVVVTATDVTANSKFTKTQLRITNYNIYSYILYICDWA